MFQQFLSNASIFLANQHSGKLSVVIDLMLTVDETFQDVHPFLVCELLLSTSVNTQNTIYYTVVQYNLSIATTNTTAHIS